MPINVGSSVSSVPLQSPQNTINERFQRISSGDRVNSASDDPAGLAISRRISSELGGFNSSVRNAGDGISLTQLAEGALSQVNNNLQRTRDLSLQAANGTLNDSDRAALQEEADQLSADTQDILSQSNFNGVELFNNDQDINIRVSAEGAENFTIEARNLQRQFEELGVTEIDFSSPERAADTVSRLDEGLQVVNEQAAVFGAAAGRFEATVDQLEVSRENSAAAAARIADTDVAEEASELASERIREQAQTAVRAQANGQSEFVLSLLS